MSAPRREVIGDAELWLGDMREVVPNLVTVDVCLTDPPFDAVTHIGACGAHGRRDLISFSAFTAHDLATVCGMLLSRTKRWLVMTCDWRHAVELERRYPESWIRLGVWTKLDGAPQFTGDRPGTGWEAVAIMHPPGRKRWNGGGRPAVWRTAIVKNEALVPSQKPETLVGDWVELFSDQGETILDPFMGSGTSGVCALRKGRRFIGIEQQPDRYEIALRRIEAAYRQADLFVGRPAPRPEQATLALGDAA